MVKIVLAQTNGAYRANAASRAVIAALAFGAPLSPLVAWAQQTPAQQTPAQQAPAQLPTVSVEDEKPAEKPLSDGYQPLQSGNVKFTEPLLDTPKTVTVIPRQLIEDRGATSLKDVLRTVPGISLGGGEGGVAISDRPFIRGFDSRGDISIDGIRSSVGSNESFNLEQVEVTKGPGSSYTGRGSTGGAINLVSKTPKAENFIEGGATLGTGWYKRGTADVNQTLSNSAALRVNLMWQDVDEIAGRNEVFDNRWGVAPSLSLGMNTATRFTLSLYYLEQDQMPDYGHPFDPRTGQPAAVDRNNFYGLLSRDFRHTSDASATAKLEHDFNDSLTLRNQLRYAYSENDYLVTRPQVTAAQAAAGTVQRNTISRNADSESLVNQTDLISKFALADTKHTVVTGIELGKEEVRNRAYTLSPSSVVGAAGSLANPNPNDAYAGTISPSGTRTDTLTTNYAVYAFDTVELSPQWEVSGGIRYDLFDTSNSAWQGSNAGLFNYSGGIVYKPLSYGSIYASYGTSSNPSGEQTGESLSATVAGTDPEKTKAYELGTKWDLLGRRLSLTSALYRTEKTNARETNLLGGVNVLDGKQRVQGIEVGLAGAITDKFKVFGGYALQQSKYLKSNTAANVGKQLTNVPEHTVSLWSTYDILPKLTIGGGANWVDKRQQNTSNTASVPDYWRFDAMASYALNETVGLRLNVQNILDETIYETGNGQAAVVAPGRTILLTTTVRY